MGKDRIIIKPKEFYDIPGNDLVWIHRDGRCVNRRTGRPIKVSMNDAGYKVLMIHVDGKTINFYHHRLLARAFIHRPDRHLDKSFDDLEVNHIDGIKSNNRLNNLEWCTSQENSDHAMANGLCNYDVVLARNIENNHIQRFINATACAKRFNIGFKRLQRHLRSKYAGYVTRYGNVFKLDDGSPWPELREEHYEDDTWERRFGVWTAASTEVENKLVIANTLAELCECLGFTFPAVQSFLSDHKKEKPYCGWMIGYDDFTLVKAVEQTRLFANRVLFPPKDVTVRNISTGEIRTFASQNIAGTELGIRPGNIRYALKAKSGIVGNFHFTVNEKV